MILFLARTGVTGSLCLKMVPLVTAGEVLWQASSVGGTWSLGMGDMGKREAESEEEKEKPDSPFPQRNRGSPPTWHPCPP